MEIFIEKLSNPYPINESYSRISMEKALGYLFYIRLYFVKGGRIENIKCLMHNLLKMYYKNNKDSYFLLKKKEFKQEDFSKLCYFIIDQIEKFDNIYDLVNNLSESSKLISSNLKINEKMNFLGKTFLIHRSVLSRECIFSILLTKEKNYFTFHIYNRKNGFSWKTEIKKNCLQEFFPYLTLWINKKMFKIIGNILLKAFKNLFVIESYNLIDKK